jgi:hypothetical protein
MTSLYRARCVCFDGQVPQPPEPEDRAVKFTQEDLNRILGEDRRKHSAAVTKIQTTLEETLKSQNLTVAERDALKTQLSEIESSFRTKEQQAAHERKQQEETYKRQLAEEKKGRESAEQRYRQSVVDRSLQDAAIKGDAFRPEQVITILRAMSRTEQVQDEKTGQFTGAVKVLIDFTDADPVTGEPVKKEYDPDTAVKRMKELPAQFGNLFKSGVVSGLGSSSGAATGANGKIDLRKLTPQQYADIRAKSPELLGLRRDKRRGV